MKTLNALFISVAAALILSSCGTHPREKRGGDTSLNNYDEKSSLDTSNVTHNSGGSGVVDNSGAGGTRIPDSGKMHNDTLKKK